MDEMLTQMSQLVSQIAQALVDKPQEVMVRGLESTNTMVLELHVGKGDVGKVIGRHGRTAQAIRTLVGAVSAKISKSLMSFMRLTWNSGTRIDTKIILPSPRWRWGRVRSAAGLLRVLSR